MASGVVASRACLDAVKTGDKPAYLTGLIMPKEVRPAYFALRALNVEVARIPEAASFNEMTAQLRYQWWRDLVNYACTGEDSVVSCKDHPVAIELKRAVEQHGLTRRWLDRLIDARERDFNMSHLDTMEDLESYAENTMSSLNYLTLELLGVRELPADHAASHVGKAVGIAAALRGLPYFHALGQNRLPLQVMTKNGLRKRAFERIASLALEQLKGKDEEGVPEGGKHDTLTGAQPAQASELPQAARDQAEALLVKHRQKAGTLRTPTPAPVQEVDVDKARSALVDAVFEVASQAHLHMEHARGMKADIPPAAIPAFWPSTEAALFLRRLEQTSHFDIFDPELRADPYWQVRLQANLLINRFRASF